MKTASGVAAGAGLSVAIGILIACSPAPGVVGGPAPAPPYALEDVPLTTLGDDLAAGRTTSAALVAGYLARIDALDVSGPALHSVIRVDATAARIAGERDRERREGQLRGALHGLPIAVKDNIDTAGMPTTAGSLALAGNDTGRDAPLIARLRDSGAIVLAKTNLSEWANFRSTRSTSGWSAVGGLTRNPYGFEYNACGSSSGSAVAVAASLAAAAIGTETDGSITCPAAINGLVGLKPTVGLVSRRHVVPISPAQDTAGPITRTVTDAAALLTVLAGSDVDDPATREADARKRDYRAGLSRSALRGKRLGVLRFLMGYNPALDARVAGAVATLGEAGATTVDIAALPALDRIDADEMTLLLADFRAAVNAYLLTTPASVTTRTLADLIAFNRANAARELEHFGQELFERAERTASHDRPRYAAMREALTLAAGRDGIDALLQQHGVDALIAPTTGPAWLSALGAGDRISGSAATLPAVAGYPHLTVPMGQLEGLPVGLSFIGSAWSEAGLLAIGYAFEQQSQARVPPTLPPVSSSPRAAASP